MYGMPGDRYFSVTYSVTEDNALNIHYHATSDKPTIINLTNHAYWNLDGYDAGGILDTVLELHGSAFTPVVKGAIPTGEIRNVAGTVFDFTKPKKIGQDIDKDDEQLLLVGGYDHNFVVDGYDGEGNYRLAARACSEKSGRIMEVYTTLPGVQFYAGNHINVSGAKGGKDCGKRWAFALETQFYPDSIHHENFPSCVFGGERVYDSMTKYLFDTL
jgi:aldose 1-epimerase